MTGRCSSNDWHPLIPQWINMDSRMLTPLQSWPLRGFGWKRYTVRVGGIVLTTECPLDIDSSDDGVQWGEVVEWRKESPDHSSVITYRSAYLTIFDWGERRTDISRLGIRCGEEDQADQHRWEPMISIYEVRRQKPYMVSNRIVCSFSRIFRWRCNILPLTLKR
jgi:hypothetical protein